MFALHRVQSSTQTFNRLLQSVFYNRVHSALNNVVVLEIDKESLEFPSVWLRDNCQCEKCFHPTAKSRILDHSNFDVKVKPVSVNKSENGVQISWNDGHTSRFDLPWLKFRSFTTQHKKNYTKTIYKPEKVTWKGNDFNEICTKHNYNEILNSEQALYNWLLKLSVYGVTLIQNTPNSETAVDGIIKKIGFSKQTHYGVKFTVQNVANTSNVAYLSSNLQMHIDLPYYEYGPGANLLHCLVQTKSEGGENLLSDGHYTAEYMKKSHPKEYELLIKVDIEWSDIGTEHGVEFYKLHRAPVIVLNARDQIERINFSIPQRGSYFPGDIEDVQPWYEAHKLFLELNHRFSAKFKTKAGDVLAFNNIRLLHGRNAYVDEGSNVRKLIGAYVDWDEIYSRLRCLKVKLENVEGI